MPPWSFAFRAPRAAATVAIAAVLAALPAACGPAPAPSPPLTPFSGAAADGSILYDVAPRDGGARLDVVATLPPGLPPRFHVEPSMIQWVRAPEIETAAGWEPLPFSGGAWSLPGCGAGCRVRYGYDLAGAAAGSGQVGYAAEHAGAFLAPPATWLLHPAEEVSGVPFRFHVQTSDDVAFVTGVFPAGGADSTYGADISDLPDAPYSAFGRLDVERLNLARATVDVAFANSPPSGRNRAFVTWIEESARAVTTYYGRFPMPHAAVIVLLQDGDSIGYASTLGGGGGAIVARLGRDVPTARLLHGWQMTHEILHLAFPGLAREHRWFEEGMATYVEPLARARVGALTEEEVWRGVVKGMFFANPLPGEGGLDETPTWARTYWGGALFCLLADVRIRERTNNARSLDDALRAVLDHGGDASVRWPIERVLEVGDAATGTTVLRDLHAEMGRAPVQVDLADLWSRLGIRNVGAAMSFDDAAPLAAVRKAMTAPAAAGKTTTPESPAVQ